MSESTPAPEGRLKAFLALALVAGCLGGLLWVGRRILQGAGPAAGVGTSVASVRIKDAQGRVSTLGELRGKVVLVDVWATWCPPCRAALPEIVRLQKAADARYAVVALSVDRGGFEDIAPFLAGAARLHPELAVEPVVPADRSALEPFGEIRGIPTTFVLDREGRILARWSGFQAGRAEAELKRALGA